jgi:hypothetical protein
MVPLLVRGTPVAIDADVLLYRYSPAVCVDDELLWNRA